MPEKKPVHDFKSAKDEFIYSPVRPTFKQLAAKWHKVDRDGFARSTLWKMAKVHDWWARREKAQAARIARKDMLMAKALVEPELAVIRRLKTTARKCQEMGFEFFDGHPVESDSVAVRLIDLGTRLEIALIESGEKGDGLPEPWRAFWKKHAKKGNGECASEVPS